MISARAQNLLPKQLTDAQGGRMNGEKNDRGPGFRGLYN